MTAKKAIEFLRIHFEYLKERWKPHPDYNVLEAIRFAISAIEKQIPKKPTEINDECGYFECPTCGDLIYAEGARFKEHKYCLSCGRKLDWSDEE